MLLWESRIVPANVTNTIYTNVKNAVSINSNDNGLLYFAHVFISDHITYYFY